MELLKNKVIIVAGGLGLIGKSFVKTIIENNGTVIVADINKKSGLEYSANLHKIYGKEKIIFKQLDITSKESILELIDVISDKFKQIDGFVNVTYPRNKNWGLKFENVSYEDFCENINLHLGGYFLTSQQMAFYFVKQGFGNIINIASIMGTNLPKFDTYEGVSLSGKEMTSPVEYNMIKAGIIILTKYMAKYFKNTNIRFNCISPGGILDSQPKKFLERYRKYCSSKGMLEAVDLNGALIFLLSDLSKYMNGQNIVIDDGWSL